mgnify:FL=1
MLVAKMMGKDFDDLADIKGEHKDKKKAKPEPVIEAKGISTREQLSHLTLPLIKERLSVLPDFSVPDVLNLYVPFTVQTRLRLEPLR